MTKEERSDPQIARSVIETLLKDSGLANQQSYLEFLGASIRFLSTQCSGKWTVTLYSDLVRLNSGWVESLVLHRAGLRVLVSDEVAPAVTVFEEGSFYRLAPGCRMVSLLHSDLTRELPPLQDAHHSALSITAVRRPTWNVAKAHSPGVVLLVEQSEKQHASIEVANQPFTFTEGQRTNAVVSRYERDSGARQACIDHHGSLCSVCGMSFKERYGDIMEGFIHVHHLIPLSHVGEEYEVDPVRDLVPVCPNCHEFLHRFDPPLSPDEARSQLRVHSQNG